MVQCSLLNVLQCVVVCCSVLQCVAVCSVLQCAEVCGSVRMHLGAVPASLAWVCCSVWRCVALCGGVLHCDALCCTVLQCADAPRSAVPAFPLFSFFCPSFCLSVFRSGRLLVWGGYME